MEQEAAVLEAVAKYFFFSCLDEQLSFAASLKVLSELKSRNWLEVSHRSEWVRSLHRWKKKLNHVRARDWKHIPEHKGFVLPADFDISVWSSFLATGDAGECEAVLFSHILGISDQEIALGLGVTEGTVRYRVGRGLRHLGGFIES